MWRSVFSAKVGPIVTLNQANLGAVTTARLLTTTFSVTLPAAATVYLADLDPAVSLAGDHRRRARADRADRGPRGVTARPRRRADALGE